MVGALRYMTGRERGRWSRVQTDDSEVPYINPVAATGKRLTDIMIASVTLGILALLFIPLAAVIKLDSRGPVLYRQLRVGRRTPSRSDFFHLIKLRTMRTDAESATGPVWATAGDPRVTRVGRFLRKSRLDELPQCINVLRGEMSIVGPRPERPAFFTRLEREIPFYAERTFGLRPGITGLAQVKLGYDASIEDVRMKVLWDHVYAMRLASRFDWIKTDLGIIFKTAVVMVTKRGSEPDASPLRGRATDREVA
jgi:lipopolysaccharide/colanic/teichoic acid biosynthesis glycosyltransferase